MTISFHRRGRDESTDRAFDSLRAALDDLKETERKEFGVAGEEMEEEDDAASAEAQSHEEEGAFIRELEQGEKADSEDLHKPDEMAMDPDNHPAKRSPKVNFRTFADRFCVVSQLTRAMQIKMPEAASVTFSPVLATQQQYLAEPPSTLSRQASASNLPQQASQSNLRPEASSFDLHQQVSSSNLRVSSREYIPLHLRKAEDPSLDQKSQK